MRRRKLKRIPQYESRAYAQLLQLVATNVRRLREERGWTQEETAHRCKMTTWQYQRVERGITNAMLTTIARLCEGFSIEPSELFTA